MHDKLISSVDHVGVSELEFNVPFQHKHVYIRDETMYKVIL